MLKIYLAMSIGLITFGRWAPLIQNFCGVVHKGAGECGAGHDPLKIALPLQVKKMQEGRCQP